MGFAVIFPGQGSQSAGMLGELAEAYPRVQATFDEASEVLGEDLWAIARDNPEDKLNKTRYTQPAMLAAGVAVWRVWEETGGGRPAFLAGHSLGEYSALVAAGALDYGEAVDVVAERGRLMQAAVPEGEGAMAAVLGLEDEAVRELCGQAAQGGVVEPVNFNAPGQVVIAGDAAAVARAVAAAEEAGAKRAMTLPVSVPSHSSLMSEAAAALGEKLATVRLRTPALPVVRNIDGRPHGEPETIVDALRRQLHNPVLWVDSIQYMAQQGADTLLEFGPGKVLAGLCKRIDRSLKAVPVQVPADLDKAREAAA